MNPTSLLLDCITRTIRSIEIHATHVSVAHAAKATWSPKLGRRVRLESSTGGGENVETTERASVAVLYLCGPKAIR
jgi:hypothetical protein